MKPKALSAFDLVKREFPPIAVHLSELEQIVQIASRRDFDVQIMDEHHEYDDLADLIRNAHTRPSKLTLRLTAKDHSFRWCDVEISRVATKVSSNKEDALLAAWHEIVAVLERKTTWLAKNSRPGQWAFLLVVLAFGSWLIPRDRWSPVLLILLNVLPVTGLAMSLYRERFVAGVHLKQVHETPGLWQKYGERLVLLVLGAAIGLLSKWIGDSWLTK